MNPSLVERPGRTRRLLTNFSWLAGGRTAGALLTLAATAIAARALGAAEFGLVVMIHAAALLIRQLANVKTAESVIRYGVPLAEGGKREGAKHEGAKGGVLKDPGAASDGPQIGELKGLILRLARIDLIAGAVAAVIGLGCLLFLTERFGLPADLQGPAYLYLGVVLVSVTGTARGTLRLLDRFGVLSAQLAVGPALKLLSVLALQLTPQAGNTVYYVLIWAGAYFVEHVYSWWRACRAFNRYYGEVKREPLRLNRREMRGFLYTTYWQGTLDAAPKQAATLLAGTLLGPAGAALFAFARELAEVLAKPVVLLRQVVFPDLARLWMNDVPRFVRVTWRTGAITAGVGLAVVLVSIVAAEPLLAALAGADFGAAGMLLTLLLLGASVELAGAAFRPAGYVMGKARALLNVQVLATTVYLVAFLGFAELFGLNGIGFASILSGIVTFLGGGYLVRRGCRARLREVGNRAPARSEA